jgi:hypothetical protein
MVRFHVAIMAWALAALAVVLFRSIFYFTLEFDIGLLALKLAVALLVLIIAYKAARQFEYLGDSRLLLLSCGLILMAAFDTLAVLCHPSTLDFVSANSANSFVTVTSASNIVAGVFFLTAIIVPALTIREGIRKKALMLFFFGCISIPAAFAVLIAVGGSLPLDFYTAAGPTALKAVSNCISVALMVGCTLMTAVAYRREKLERFVFYSAAAGLLALSFTSFLFLSNPEDSMVWAGAVLKLCAVIAVFFAIRSAYADSSKGQPHF